MDKSFVDFVRDKYPPVGDVEYTALFKDGMLRLDVFRLLLDKLDPTKSPGFPLTSFFTTNQDLEEYVAELYDLINFRLHSFEELGVEVLDNDFFNLSDEQALHVAIELTKSNRSCPVGVGEKKEPRAIEDGKRKPPRLVSQVSLITNRVLAVIVGDALLLEQRQKGIVPTAVALDLFTPSELEDRFNTFAAVGEMSTSDVRGWEYSVRKEERWRACFWRAYSMNLISFCENERGYIVNPGKSQHFHALIGVYFSLIYRLVVTPCGDVLFPPPGQVSSGELVTFSDNSFMRADAANRVSLTATGSPVKHVFTAGDDCLDTNGNHLDIYRALGKEITDFSIQKDRYNFCSTTFLPEGGTYQDNIRRTTYSIMGHISDESLIIDHLEAFKTCYARHPEFLSALDLITECLMLSEFDDSLSFLSWAVSNGSRVKSAPDVLRLRGYKEFELNGETQ